MKILTAECVAEVLIKPNHVNELGEYLIEGAVSDATWSKCMHSFQMDQHQLLFYTHLNKYITELIIQSREGSY